MLLAPRVLGDTQLRASSESLLSLRAGSVSGGAATGSARPSAAVCSHPVTVPRQPMLGIVSDAEMVCRPFDSSVSSVSSVS